MAKQPAEIVPASHDDERDAVKRELYELAKKHDGRIEPENVVEAARDVDSPMHRLFTWDDSVAAERYRLLQAGALIRRIKITVIKSDPETRAISVSRQRAIESPMSERDVKGLPPKGGSYVRAATIAKDPKLRAAMVETVVVELSAMKKRYSRLTELSAVWEAIAEIEKD